jgi:hypothetical protein
LQSEQARSRLGTPAFHFLGSRDVPFDADEPLPPDMLDEPDYPDPDAL